MPRTNTKATKQDSSAVKGIWSKLIIMQHTYIHRNLQDIK